MKKIVKYTGAALASIMLFSFAGCDMLQGSLSSEMQSEMEQETGTGIIIGSKYFYNGCSTTDMSENNIDSVVVNYSKKVTASNSGLTVKFSISYKDSDKNLNNVAKSVTGSAAGYISSDGKSVNVYMKPVLDILDGNTALDGVVDVEMTISGLVCAEGSQKGRTIGSVTKKLNVSPLWTSTVLSSTHSLNTVGSTNGKAIKIRSNAEDLDVSSASLVVTSSSIPAGIDSSDFTLSTDGSSLYISSNIDLVGTTFTGSVVVSGIKTGNSTVYDQEFSIGAMPLLETTEVSVSTTSDGPSYPVSGMVLSYDSTNLYVKLDFESTPGGWEADYITILVDDEDVTTGTASDSLAIKPAETLTGSDTIEFAGNDIFKDGTSDSVSAGNMSTNADTWVQNGSTWLWSPASGSTITYTIPWSKISSSAISGKHNIRVAAFATEGWEKKPFAIVPKECGTLSGTTFALDMSKALSLDFGAEDSGSPSSVVPARVKYLSATSIGTDSVTICWSTAYNATSYKVAISEDNGENWTETSGVTATEKTYSSLNTNTNYLFRVISVSSDATESEAKLLQVKTGEVAAAPTILASNSGAKVVLSWNNISNADKYRLYRGTTSGSLTAVATIPGTKTTYTDSTVSQGVTYFYAISAINKYGEGSKSTEAEIETLNLPGAFTLASSFTYNPEGTDVTITGITSTNADEYKVYYKKTADSSYTLVNKTITAGTVVLDALETGSYSVKVVAKNTAGETDSTVAVKVYPTVILDGTKSATEYWTTASSDTWGTLSNVYVTNDDSYLYIAFESGSALSSYKDDARLSVVISDAAATTGDTTYSYAGWGKAGPAITTTLTNGFVKYVGSVTTGGSAVTSDSSTLASSVTWSGTNPYTADSTFVELKIPLSSVGTSGTTIKFAAFWSNYNWAATPGNFVYVEDVAPSTAVSTSGSVEMSDAWTINNTYATVDMAQAISYTIK